VPKGLLIDGYVIGFVIDPDILIEFEGRFCLNGVINPITEGQNDEDAAAYCKKGNLCMSG
jgi:hypothetical protein